MKRILAAVAAISLAGPAMAGGYRVELAPSDGKAQVRNSLSTIAQQSSSGMTAQSVQSVPGGSSAGSGTADVTIGLKQRGDDSLLPGAKTFDMIGEVLMPEEVVPQKASGGYLVFDMPKELHEAKADLPLTIIVKTGPEEHRFAAVLKRK